MDIKKLVTKPKLIQLEVDTPEVVEIVGESVIFYMMDHLDLGTYFDFYKLEHMYDNAEVFLTVIALYTVIFTFSYVYNRLTR